MEKSSLISSDIICTESQLNCIHREAIKLSTLKQALEKNNMQHGTEQKEEWISNPNVLK